MNNIFEYTNYRDLLQDFFHARKAKEGYTYRTFSAQAGMNSSSWLMHLIKGTKNLSDDTIIKVARVLGYRGKESEYFDLLVRFSQAESNDSKNCYYQKMIALKRTLKIAGISDAQYEYYSKWYHPVVRSLVSKISFGEDFGLLARKLVPCITPVQAKKSVLLLERLGLIKRTGTGSWTQADPVISTGDEVSSLNVVNYHKQASTLAEDAFDRSPRETRDISALTIGINEKDFHCIKEKIQAFRKEILEIVQNSENADRVYQLNFQFFPVSEAKREAQL